MKNEQLKIAFLVFLLTLITGFIGYTIGDIKRYNEETSLSHPIDTVFVDNYDVTPGKDGIIQLSADRDSLFYVIFVQDKDTFALDALKSSELDSLFKVLYKDNLLIK